MKILALCLRILIFPTFLCIAACALGWWWSWSGAFACACAFACVSGGGVVSAGAKNLPSDIISASCDHTSNGTLQTSHPSPNWLLPDTPARPADFLVYYKPIFLGCVEEQTVASVRVANPRFDFNGRVGRCRESQTMSLGESPDPSCRQLNHSSSSCKYGKPTERSAGTQKTKKHTIFSKLTGQMVYS